MPVWIEGKGERGPGGKGLRVTQVPETWPETDLRTRVWQKKSTWRKAVSAGGRGEPAITGLWAVSLTHIHYAWKPLGRWSRNGVWVTWLINGEGGLWTYVCGFQSLFFQLMVLVSTLGEHSQNRNLPRLTWPSAKGGFIVWGRHQYSGSQRGEFCGGSRLVCCGFVDDASRCSVPLTLILCSSSD